MRREEICAIISEIGIVPAVRAGSAEDARFAAEAVALAGIPVVEITMTVPGAVSVIAQLTREHKDLVVGAGTVLTPETARECIDAGAGFITAPGFDAQIVELAAKRDVASLPGALTPTEIVNAWRAGADMVKVFPCAPVGGSHYIRSLKKSLPQVPMMAAGGVNQKTATDFILAGAAAIGVGAELIPMEAILERRPERIRELTRRFLGYVHDARERLQGAYNSA
jgi:2-dehydro-3-deoxyphosphogluconate aldolase / (4S)-4-hydroxy-2-oxoglutarate aldolase